MILSGVLYPKEIPLAGALSSGVVFHVQLVFKGTNFHCFAKVATLKSRLKHQSLVSWQLGLAWLGVLVQHVWVDAIERLELLIVTIKSWSTCAVSFLGDD